MITAVRRIRFAAEIPVLVVLALAGCSSTADDAPSFAAERPGAVLEEPSCSRDPRRCPADARADGPSDAHAANRATVVGDTLTGTDAEAEAASPDFTACRFDSDCVAVPQVGCCHLGFIVAVNRALLHSYESSFTCSESRPICPMYIVVDHRVPQCDNATRRCTMISADRIACGGFVMNQHRCPEGYLCDVHNRPPDIPGVCVPEEADAD